MIVAYGFEMGQVAKGWGRGGRRRGPRRCPPGIRLQPRPDRRGTPGPREPGDRLWRGSPASGARPPRGWLSPCSSPSRGGRRPGRCDPRARERIGHCSRCYNLAESDQPLCRVCRDEGRDRQVICVVEEASDAWPWSATT